MWSLGITALELFKGYPPFAHYEAMEAIIRTCQGDPPYFDTYGESTHTPSRAFFSWVEMVLKKNPEDRPSLPRLLSHRFLSRFTDEECHQILVSYFASIPELSDESSKETFKSPPSRSTPKWKYCSVCNKHTKL